MVSATLPARCAKCSAALATDEKFCGECGQPVESQAPPPPIPPPVTKSTESRKCVRCGANAGENELFCGECGATLGPNPAPAHVEVSRPAPPRPTQQRPTQQRPTSIIRILLGIILGLMPVVALVSIVTLAILLHNGYWNHRNEIEVVSTFLMLSVFLFGLCLVTLFPRIYLAYLFLSIVWILGGFAAMRFFGSGWSFWPDWTFASGISNLIGATIGLVIAKITGRSKKT